MSLENRVAVITGATGGLGTVVAQELSHRVAKLALLDIDPDRLAGVTKNLSINPNELLTQAVNLLNREATQKTADMIASHFGKIDILLHLVGGWNGGKSLVETGSDDLAFMINQHVWTSFHVIQAFVPHIVKNGWGRVVMITSPYAARPNAKGGPYAIGKAGQESMMLTLSQELRGTGVTANLLQAKAIDVKGEKLTTPTQENASWTTPQEITAVILYLLSDEAGTINGAKIPLFGSY